MMFEYVCQTWTLSPYGLAPIFVAVSIINIQHNMTYKKNIGSTTKIIHELTQEEVTIAGLPFTEKEGQFIFEESSPSLLLRPKGLKEFYSTLFDGPYWYDSLEVSTKSGRSYKISQAHLSFPEKLSLEDANYKCYVQFYQLMDSGWDEKTEYCYRYILPVKDHKWQDLIERPISDYLHISPDYVMPIYWALVRIDFSGEKQIHLSELHIDDIGESKFIVIETRFPCTYSAMDKYLYSISLSLGLVTSVAPFDYAIVVTSKTPDFEGEIMGGIVKLHPTIKSQYRFIATDIRELYNDLKEKVDYDAFRPYCDKEGKLLRSHLDPMKEQEFSALVSMLHRSKDLARATRMLLVASFDIDYMGPIYSVVLETICSVSYKENEDFFKPFLVKKRWGYDFKKNEAKLTKPFELQQIAYELSDAEKKIIKTRNNFLHGGTTEEGKESTKKLRYICMELRKLCGILLLRYAGYKGPILNNAVEMGLEEALKNKEPLFITYEEKTESPQPTENPEAGV